VAPDAVIAVYTGTRGWRAASKNSGADMYLLKGVDPRAALDSVAEFRAASTGLDRVDHPEMGRLATSSLRPTRRHKEEWSAPFVFAFGQLVGSGGPLRVGRDLGLVNVLLPGPTSYNRPSFPQSTLSRSFRSRCMVAPWSRGHLERRSGSFRSRRTRMRVGRVRGTPPRVYGVYFSSFSSHGSGCGIRGHICPSGRANRRLVSPADFTSHVDNADFVRSVGVVIPVCVILGEVMSRPWRR